MIIQEISTKSCLIGHRCSVTQGVVDVLQNWPNSLFLFLASLKLASFTPDFLKAWFLFDYLHIMTKTNLPDLSTVNLNVGAVTVKLDSTALADVIRNLPDTEAYKKLYEALIAHPSSRVRANIADKEQLGDEAIHLLAKDGSVEVIRNLARNRTVREVLSLELTLLMIERDVEVADTIASYVEDWSNTMEIAKILKNHSDPQVRLSLANNRGTPKTILRQQLKDPEESIAIAAKENLR